MNDPENSDRASRKLFRRYFPLLLIVWIVLVLYPNPVNFVVSIQRIRNFAADPYAVESMLSDLPSEPVEIEKAVLTRIRYRHDWQVYGMPWYCPTVDQVLERGEGDCKSRAMVLASVLEARNVTYKVHLSPIHIWVDYESKNETSFENTEVEFYQYDPETGERQFQIPHIAVSEVMDSFWESFWGAMPDVRKALLILGLLALIAARVILRKKRTAGQTGG
jgi:hypothetical protein